MSRLHRVPKIVALALTIIIITSSLQGTARGQADLDPVVILFDASHEPQLSPTSATIGLKLVLDMANASTRFIVRIEEDGPLDDKLLSDVDILMIAGPDEDALFGEDELNGIAEMLANGSSVFILGDPTIDQHTEYWDEPLFQNLGENFAINTFLDGLNMTGVRFSVNQTSLEPLCDTMFDYDHALNESYPYVFKLDSTTWDSTHPIFRNINVLYTMTATLKPTTHAGNIGKSYDTSFAQYKRSSLSWANYSYPNMTLADFEERPLSYSAINGTYPSWLSAFEYGNGRVVVSASTIMFTGATLPLPDADLQWFYAGDNSRLFMNILSWLSEGFAEVPSVIGPMLILSSVVLVIGVAYYMVKKIR
jgi:hypothetical protein